MGLGLGLGFGFGLGLGLGLGIGLGLGLGIGLGVVRRKLLPAVAVACGLGPEGHVAWPSVGRGEGSSGQPCLPW